MPLSPFDCLGLRPVLSHRSKENFGKNLDDTASSSSPSVVLLGSASTDGTTEPDEVIIGRLQLLSALLSACGCGAAGDQDNSAMDYMCDQHQPKPTSTTDATAPSQRCQECCDTLHWASYALSRRMFRFENKGSSMQVRGKHATVKVNEMTVDVSTSENDDWSQPPIQLQKGDRLQIFPRSGRGSAEFQVVPVQILPPTKASVDHNYAKKTSIQPQNGKGDCTTKENDLAKVEQENMKQTQATEDAHGNELQPKPISTIKATKEIGAQMIGPTKIFFVPSGHDFFEHRRQILQQKLEELGAVFTNKIFDAQYIVISGSVRSLGVAAKRSAVLDSKLQKHLQQHQSVQCLLPSWADECISSQTLLLPPGRKHVWPHYRAHASPQRKREHDTMEQSKKRQRVAVPSSSRKPFPNNVKCAEVFKQLSNLHQDMPLLDLDQWKSYCFRIAAGRLLHLDFEVDTDPATLRRLRGVKGFGKSVVDKIEEILNTGTVSRIHEFQHHPERVAMKKLTDIWGVGRVKAKDLMVLGYKDIHDVRDGLKTSSGIAKLQLDRNQLVGVDCYEDILDRMNRDEVEQIKDAVEKAAQRVYPGVEVTVQGSYRRGKRTCGDVDIHLTHRSFHEEIPDHALGNIMDVLWDQGHIAYHLTVVNGMSKGMRVEDFERHSVFVPSQAWRSAKHRTHYTTEHNSFWMGCFYSPVKPTTRRRVDIKFYPYRERAFATVYFTGNGFLNRSMRLWAKRVFKWRLSDHGLFDLEDGLKRVMEASTEEEIFDKLKLVYKHPHERDSFDALEPKREALEEDGVLDEDMQMQLSETDFQQEETGYVWVD